MMTFRFLNTKTHLPVTVAAAIALMALTAGCSSDTKIKDEHFWQLADTNSAIYQRGPKAQQMLNRDISRCVVEIRELEMLGSIRRATPAELKRDGAIPDPHTPEGRLEQWETPSHTGALRAEHLDYHDFESCMRHKGWERVRHVPYSVSENAREVYSETILGTRYRSKTGQRPPLVTPPRGPYEELND